MIVYKKRGTWALWVERHVKTTYIPDFIMMVVATKDEINTDITLQKFQVVRNSHVCQRNDILAALRVKKK